jgi:hypothetical protein
MAWSTAGSRSLGSGSSVDKGDAVGTTAVAASAVGPAVASLATGVATTGRVQAAMTKRVRIPMDRIASSLCENRPV